MKRRKRRPWKGRNRYPYGIRLKAAKLYLEEGYSQRMISKRSAVR